MGWTTHSTQVKSQLIIESAPNNNVVIRLVKCPLLIPVSSPFEVKIGSEAGPQQVRAWGPGLESGVVGKSADFVVEAVGDDVGTLGMFH